VPEAALRDCRDETAPGAERAAIERYVARLPPRQRSVVTLRVFADLPFKEIARAEGITENAAKVNFHHAIVTLRAWLTSGR
jgi:RNA polymerase sigma-70 factor (ECF subfamily)